MIFSVAEEQDSTCFHLNLLLLFISKAHGILRSHAQNFTIKRTLTKTFAGVSSQTDPDDMLPG